MMMVMMMMVMMMMVMMVMVMMMMMMANALSKLSLFSHARLMETQPGRKADLSACSVFVRGASNPSARVPACALVPIVSFSSASKTLWSVVTV